jgi:actin-related protein 9
VDVPSASASRAYDPAFAPALMTFLSPFLLSSTDLPSDVQPARVRLLSIP